MAQNFVYIMVSLDTSIEDIILLGSCSRMVLFQFDFVASENNLADSLTKDFNGERTNCASKGMGLKV